MKHVGFIIFIAWCAIMLAVAGYLKAPISVEPAKIPPLLILFALTRFIWAYNWSLLNKHCDLRSDYRTLLKATLVSGLMDAVTPSMLPGAEVAASYYLKEKFGGRFAQHLAVVLSQSILIAVSQIMLLFLALLLLSAVHYPPALVPMALILAAILLAAILLPERLVKAASGWPFRSILHYEDVTEQMHRILSSRSLIMRLLPVYILGLSMEGFAVYGLIDAPSADYLVSTFAFLASTLIAMISMIPGGVGVYEISFYGILDLAAVPSAAILSALVAYRTIFLWMNVALGGYILNREMLRKLTK